MADLDQELLEVILSHNEDLFSGKNAFLDEDVFVRYLKANNDENLSENPFFKELSAIDILLNYVNLREYHDFPLHKIPNIVFRGCTIGAYPHHTEINRFIFDNCIFEDEQDLIEDSLNSSYFNNDFGRFAYKFSNCKFKDILRYRLVYNESKGSTDELDFALFVGCRFDSVVWFDNVDVNFLLLNNTRFIGKLEILNCKLGNGFWGCSPQYISISNSVFGGKCEISAEESISVSSSVFEKPVFFKKGSNRVRCLEIYNSKFNDSVSFRGLKSGITSEELKEQLKNTAGPEFFGFDSEEKSLTDRLEEFKTIFRNVEFYSFVDFTECNFQCGLDFEDVFYKIPPNFSKIETSYELTSRETYRTIKDSLDSSGNRFEANKYYALEIDSFRDELSKNKTNSGDWLIFKFSSMISSHGQSWIRALGWIFLLYLINILFIVGFKQEWFSNIHDIKAISVSINYLNDVFAKIPPYKIFKSEGFEFVGFFLNVFYYIVLYQLIISVKRLTRR